MTGADIEPQPAAGSRDRQAVAELCHELRGYLAASLMLIETLQSRESETTIDAPLSLVRQQLDSMSTILTTELDHARQQSTWIDLADLVDRCARMAAVADGVSVRLQVGPRPVIVGRRPQLQRAITSLLDNACRATLSGTVRIQITEGDTDVNVVIEDDGPGFGRIPRATGQGLEQARNAVLAHGGSLEISSSPTGGTRARLTLPQQTTTRRAS